ncbi:MAG: alpha-L-fucosidase [Lachnospiraceae bacterium]|nr:alpha-L-fucosidase [Lachnospiraceae bacterium]
MDREKYLKLIDEVNENGTYHADWASLTQWQTPRWFTKEKFGIFIHWGIFSVPAFGNEWYSRSMYCLNTREYEHHIKTYGPQKEFGYKDFIPMFKAEKFDADEWINLFKKAGARYVVPVAEHHDGFQMYESELSHWNAKEMGPKRDIVGELKSACEKENMIFATSTHRAEHYWFLGCGREFESDIDKDFERGHIYWPSFGTVPDMSDVHSPVASTKEFLDDWLLRCCEIIDKYKPALLYFDWWIMHESYKEHLKKLMAYYYNRAEEWGREVAIIYKHDPVPFGSGIPDVERGKFGTSQSYSWQTDTAVAYNSWCYIDGLDYKKSDEIVCYLVDVVSKNGNLLLNIGPKSDGTIPDGDKQILLDIGEWLSVNGEAIYNSKPFKKSSEGPTLEAEGKFSDVRGKEYTKEDYRFTCGNGAVYAINLNYPEDGKLLVRTLGISDFNSLDFQGIIKNVSILGYGEVSFEHKTEGLYVYGPSRQELGVKPGMPVTIKVVTD